MRKRLAIISILLFVFMFVPLAGMAEPAPLPVKTHQVQVGSPELPIGVGIRAADADAGVETAPMPTEKAFDMVGITWEGENNEADSDHLAADAHEDEAHAGGEESHPRTPSPRSGVAQMGRTGPNGLTSLKKWTCRIPAPAKPVVSDQRPGPPTWVPPSTFS